MPERTKFRDSALRAVAIIGLIAILVLGAWGIIQIVVGLPDFFSGFGNSSTPRAQTSAEHVTVSAPTLVTSGQPFTLSWAHTNASGNYSFTFSYACADGLSFAAPVPTGQYQQVPCNTPFNYTNASGNVQLIPVLSNQTKQTNTSITVSATRLSDNTVSASGSTTLTVLPQASAKPAQPAASDTTATQTTPRPTSTYTPSGRTSNLYGTPDLSVRVLSAQPVAGRYSVQFEVSNVGTNVAPYGWEFSAQLPLNPPYTFVSQAQQKLYPGDKIVYTLGFDMPTNSTQPYNYSYPYAPTNCGYNQNYTYDGYYNYPTGYGYSCTNPNPYQYPNYYGNAYPFYGANTFSITVDSQNLLNDYNRGNNTASVTLGY